ncbi:MAG: GntR family transcriptional regulator, partial [Sphingopyxis sp.]
LAAEGFLQPVGKRGFVIADFGEREIFDALEMRSLLEGWAARSLAEQGIDAKVLADLEDCLAQGDALFEKRHLDLDDEQQYGLMNERFHRLVVEGCKSPLLSTFIDRLNNVPFVTPSVIVFDQIGLRAAFDMLHRAHGFHHAIVDAIKTGDGARAEFLFREHANHQRVSMFERRRAKPATTAEPAPATRGKTRQRRKAAPVT